MCSIVAVAACGVWTLSRAANLSVTLDPRDSAPGARRIHPPARMMQCLLVLDLVLQNSTAAVP